MKLHAEFIRICAPLKRQIQALDVRPRSDFHGVLLDLITELKREGYKLTRVSKHHKVGEHWQVNGFWRRKVVQDGTEVNFVCKSTVSLKADFRIILDFDFWLEFPALRESVRARLHELLRPGPLGRVAGEVMKAEINRVWGEIENAIQGELLRSFPEGWGKHGLDERIERREAKWVFHAGECTLAQPGDFSKLLAVLQGVGGKALELVKATAEGVRKAAGETFDKLVPLPLETEVEGLLVSALSRHAGAFEYQLRRFVHENSAASTHEITEALRRLELWGYIARHRVPPAIGRELEKLGIRRFRNFYTRGPVEPRKGQPPRLPHVRGGIRPEPLPLGDIPNFMRAPKHLVNRAILRMLRRGTLRRWRTVDHLGRRVVEGKVVRRPRGATELELEVITAITRHHQKQLQLLGLMREHLKGPAPENAIYIEKEWGSGENAEDTHNL